MTQQHPTTPPPELIKQWYMEATGPDYEGEIARRAAQWGADQELEACRMEIIDGAGLFYIDETSDRVRLTEDIWIARRPKPPKELLKQWEDDWFEEREHADVLLVNAYAAGALAGADAELEACCEWFVRDWTDVETADKLRIARRPKPPSLKKQALDLLDKAEDPSWDINDFSIVRRALEQLDG